MKNKKILLTLNPDFYSQIESKANERLQTMQDYIYETLRGRVYAPPVKKSRAGRPKKVDDPFIEHFSRAR
ncbi:hypothetical protein J4219_03700 [Candidatus Woesearchaeota archaeon]|nr:hypothetical protein [Candidatus Woesearchaeota archaeon]